MDTAEKEKRTIGETIDDTIGETSGEPIGETNVSEKRSRIRNIFEPNPDIIYTNENTIIFSSVRMNPPTPGHLHLIDTLINVAMSINISKVYLILSKTQNCDNPLTCDEKKYWLSELIKSKNYPVGVEIICVEDKPGQTRGPSPFTPVGNLISTYTSEGEKNINLIMVLGTDRVGMLENITNIFYSNNENVNSIDGVVLPRDEKMEFFKNLKPEDLFKMLSETEGNVPIEIISASLIRKIVANGAKDAFKKIYENYLSPDKIDLFYEKINDSLQICKNMKGLKQSSTKIKGYTYPIIKPEIPTKKTGGKSVKRKTTKRKTIKRKTIKRKTIKRKMIKRKMIKTKKYNKRLK